MNDADHCVVLANGQQESVMDGLAQLAHHPLLIVIMVFSICLATQAASTVGIPAQVFVTPINAGLLPEGAETHGLEQGLEPFNQAALFIALKAPLPELLNPHFCDKSALFANRALIFATVLHLYAEKCTAS